MKKHTQMEFDFGESPKPADETRRYLVELTDGWDGKAYASVVLEGTWKDACEWISANAHPDCEIWGFTRTAEGKTVIDYGSHTKFGRIS